MLNNLILPLLFSIFNVFRSKEKCVETFQLPRMLCFFTISTIIFDNSCIWRRTFHLNIKRFARFSLTHFGAVHKRRHQSRGEGGFVKRWSYLISLFSDEEGGGESKISKNDVFYERTFCPKLCHRWICPKHTISRKGVGGGRVIYKIFSM